MVDDRRKERVGKREPAQLLDKTTDSAQLAQRLRANQIYSEMLADQLREVTASRAWRALEWSRLDCPPANRPWRNSG